MEKTTNALVVLERLGRLLQNDAHRHGLKPTQWEALRYLGRANRFSRSPGAVTAYLGMTKGTVSQTLAALERKGLIRKVTVPKDRRNVTIEMTRKGTALLKKDPLEDLEAATLRLADEQRTQLGESLRQLLGNALQQRDGRPFGACNTCRHFQKDAEDGKPHRCGLLDEPLSAPDSELICVEQEPLQV
ncbi:MAG: MarR family transcriptional regulator [Woeseiaceae bacterium]|nr:MarR family transcriptional regulator [Woeseiaceae bacterium]